MDATNVETESWLQRWYKRQGEVQNKRLFDALAAGESMQPRWNLSKVLAYFLAILVHSFTLLLFVGGLLMTLLILSSTSYILCSAIGLILVLVTWALRPRVPPVPEDTAARKHFKTLYRVADEVAQQMQTRPAAYLVINEEFNARFILCGWQRHPVVVMGLLLWERLEPQERVALIAHELAHGINGDATGGLIIGTAINSLYAWYGLLYPSRYSTANLWRPVFSTVGQDAVGLGKIFSWLFANIAWGMGFCLNYLLLHNSRRAEYLADALAASTAGTDAVIGMLEKIRQRPFQPEDLPGLQSTHPPLSYRIEMLRLKPAQNAVVTLTKDDSERIGMEMTYVVEAVNQKLRQRRRAY